MKPVLLSICLIGLAGICLTGLSLPATAQPSASFFVFSIKGSGYYLRDRFRIPLKIGTALSVTDELVLGPKAEVRLLCNKFSLFTIRPGIAGAATPLRKYADSCINAGRSSATQTLAYIWNRFSSGKGGVAGEGGEGAVAENEVASNKNDYLQEYGADTRGCADPVFNALPDTLSVYREGFFIRYHPADTAERYLLSIFADAKSGFPRYQAPLEANRFALPDSALRQLDTGTDYYYTVARNGQEYCERKIIRRLGDAAMAALRNEICAGSGFQQLSPADKHAITAFFFEKAHLVAEASRYYRHALQKDPGNTLATLQAGKLDSLIGFY